MPHLLSDSGAMRLSLRLVQRETTRGQPGSEPPPGRVLTTAAIEWIDQRDAEWWPFVRLPPLWVDEDALAALGDGTRELLQGAVPGFSWQAGTSLGLQLGLVEGAAVVELGVDLGPFLADASGLRSPAAGEAALFRFGVKLAELVRFAGEVEAELAAIRGGGAP